ncbi:hypothetical protein PGQ11_009964 [Apiospora arundinis]|uniref:Uncharacterized protein n=1 Tax=Apiospora arundinis TaxID=335852 RepID=A0ABR2IA12_9PEZI
MEGTAVTSMIDAPLDEIGEVELTWRDLKLGTFVRQDKYAKIYSIVSSEWAEEAQWEAHVFEIQGRQQVRFLERMVWPKMRKSANYERDFIRDSTRIFVYRIPEETELVGSKLTKAKRKTLRPVDTAITMGAEAGVRGENRAIEHKEPRTDPVEFVRQIFICHCVRMGEPVPKFDGGQLAPDLPSFAQPDELRDGTADELWEKIECDAKAFIGEGGNDPAGQVVGPGQVPLPTASSNTTKTSCRNSRPLPQDRDVEMILGLAKMIEAEPVYIFPDGRSQPGRSFFLKHLNPQMHRPEGTSLEVLAAKQQDWTEHLARLVERIPAIVKNLTKERAGIWRSSIPIVLQMLGYQEDDEQSEKMCDNQSTIDRRWVDLLRWMIEQGFDGFDSDAIQALAQGLSIAYAPTTAAWFFRIRSHIQMYKWAEASLEHGTCISEVSAPNTMLTRMLRAYTRRELVIGMRPLLERMRWVSELTSKYWKYQVACSEFRDMLSKDSGLQRPSWENSSGLFSLSSYYPNLPHGVFTDPYLASSSDESR